MRISREHSFELEDARERVTRLASELERSYKLRSEWQGDRRLKFNGGGASGDVVIDEHSIELNVKLGFALKLMEPAIRAAIEETLDEQIGTGS